MAFTEKELQEHKKALDAFLEKRRPPEAVRDQVDLDYRIEGQSVLIFERRMLPFDPRSPVDSPVAKMTYIRSRNVWRLYWQPHDAEWHGYEPRLEVDSLAEALEVVDTDRHACFWG